MVGECETPIPPMICAIFYPLIMINRVISYVSGSHPTLLDA